MARPSDPHAKVDLLRAAESVFAERGLEDAKIEEITRRAGRSKGSFYLHFQSKEDAFRQIVETMLARLASVIAECTDRQADSIGDPARLLDLWLAKDVEIFEFIWQNRSVASLLLGGGGSARFGYLIDEFAERNRAAVKQLLAWGIEHGMYRADLDVEVASLVISAAYDRVARELVRMKDKPDLRAWLREVRTLIVCGAGTELVRVVDRPVKAEGATPRRRNGAAPRRPRARTQP